jgi:ParB-like chromosome segregation protein Spo0J
MKKIETTHLKPSEIKSEFGNPRNITKEKLKELENSIEKLGDFGCIVVDENNNVISGNQRLQDEYNLDQWEV